MQNKRTREGMFFLFWGECVYFEMMKTPKACQWKCHYKIVKYLYQHVQRTL
jgi:hypothetical protein